MKRVVYVISSIDRWIAFEWIADSLRHDFELSFVLLNNGDSYFESFLRERGIPFVRFNYASKKDLPKTIFKLTKYFKELRPSAIHTHFLDANLVGLSAGWLAHVPQRIYTRHHSVFHLRFHRKGKIYDWLSNLLATRIVAISESVKNILIKREHVNPLKIALIHHGFDLTTYQGIQSSKVVTLRSKFELPDDHFVFGVVSRYIDWKGVVYIVKAFKQLREDNPKSFLLLMNARGPDIRSVKDALSELPEGSYKEVSFEKDMHIAYQLFDCFIHTPIDEEVEAFGQVYIEAMAAGIPSIVTLSGIASDYVRHLSNAIVVPHCDSDLLAEAMRNLRNDLPFHSQMVEQALTDVEQRFDFEEMRQRLVDLYENRE